jgi:hypothetical protein
MYFSEEKAKIKFEELKLKFINKIKEDLKKRVKEIQLMGPNID